MYQSRYVHATLPEALLIVSHDQACYHTKGQADFNRYSVCSYAMSRGRASPTSSPYGHIPERRANNLGFPRLLSKNSADFHDPVSTSGEGHSNYVLAHRLQEYGRVSTIRFLPK